MGEEDIYEIRMGFDPSISIQFHGAKVTTDAGFLLASELDEALGLTRAAEAKLTEKRTGRNVQHDLHSLLMQSVYSRLAGYEDVNDHERLSVDPAMRAAVGKLKEGRDAASAGTVSRFETDMLADDENFRALCEIPGDWAAIAMEKTKTRTVILDMDSSDSTVFGNQEGGKYNTHFGSVCYHPLFCFNQFGDCEAAKLRPGNVHSADCWRDMLEPIVKRYKEKGLRIYFRGDAAFAKPGIYDYLEENGVLYAIRIPSNAVLERKIEHLTASRPVGRPPKKPVVLYEDFSYRADSWEVPRRVIAKVEWHQGELFPRVGFIVTNKSAKPKGVTAFYNKRGTAEQWIKEGKNTINWTKLSCSDFRPNEVRLQLFVLAYNLGNFLRRLALPKAVSHWSLASVQLKMVKIGAKMVSHARRFVFQAAEVAFPRDLFAKTLSRIRGLRPQPG